MDAKSGKSFLVTGMGSGNDLKFGEKAVAISIKKSHTLIVIYRDSPLSQVMTD